MVPDPWENSHHGAPPAQGSDSEPELVPNFGHIFIVKNRHAWLESKSRAHTYLYYLSLVDVRIFLFFFPLGGGEGGVRVDSEGGGRFFY